MFWGIVVTLFIQKGVSQQRRDAPADPSLCDTSLVVMKLSTSIVEELLFHIKTPRFQSMCLVVSFSSLQRLFRNIV